MIVQIKFINPIAKFPIRANPGDAGYDLLATSDTIILPGERALLKTGIAIAIPEGYYGRIAPRSGLAFKNGIDVMAGVIDSTYRGEIGVILLNTDKAQPLSVKAGDKIAQIIFEACHSVTFDGVDELSETKRAAGGFGSTGR